MACHACGLYYPAACKTCGAIGDPSECGGLTRSAARIMMLSEPDFEAKLAEIRARGAVRIAEAQAKEHAPAPPADVQGRDMRTGLPLAPVGDVGAEREAQAAPVHLCDVCAAKALEILEECGKREADLHRSSLDALIRLREDFAAEMRIRLGHRVVGGEG